jgi:hypothetical protein
MRAHNKFEEPPQWNHVPPKILNQAEELASLIAINERAMLLLKKENDSYRIQLTDIMLIYKIPHLNVVIQIKKGIMENFSIELITQRGNIPVKLAARKLFKKLLKPYIPDDDMRKKAITKIANVLEEYLRIDSFLVTKLRGCKWAEKLIESKDTKPFVRVNEGHKSVKDKKTR